MILRSDNFNLFLLFASVFSSLVFCIGFFPYGTVHVNKKDGIIRAQENIKIEANVNRSILMIIDALRLDFIESKSFDYLHHLLDNKEACLLKLTVNLPTVTKPRIKVRTHHSNSSFVYLLSYLLGANVWNYSELFRRCDEFRKRRDDDRHVPTSAKAAET